MGPFRRRTAALAAIFLSAVLSGCAEFPALTQEEYDLIVDYSAGVLSKYSTGNGDKLTRVAPLVPEEPEGNAEQPTADPAPAQKQGTPVSTSPAGSGGEGDAAVVWNEGESEQQPTGNDDSRTDQAEAASGQEEVRTESGADPSAGAQEAETAEIGNGDILQRLQSGIGVNFNGYYVLNSYPDGAPGNLTLTAEPGKKLLILSFTLSNQSGAETRIDFLDANATFTLLVNGTPVSKNLVTLLENDLSTYVGNVGGGDQAGAVLCFQVDEAVIKDMDTLHLKVNYHGEEQKLVID